MSTGDTQRSILLIIDGAAVSAVGRLGTTVICIAETQQMPSRSRRSILYCSSSRSLNRSSNRSRKGTFNDSQSVSHRYYISWGSRGSPIRGGLAILNARNSHCFNSQQKCICLYKHCMCRSVQYENN